HGAGVGGTITQLAQNPARRSPFHPERTPGPSRGSPLSPLVPGHHIFDRCRPRVCENAQEPTSWRIVFSIALFPIAATALFLLRLAKSRRIFYAQIECLCFRTGWTLSGHSASS